MLNKLRGNIDVGSLSAFTGIGAVTGGVGGAIMSDDGIASGAFRGALFGGGIGGVAHLLPKGINATFKDKEWSSYNGDVKGLIGDAADSFKGTYGIVNQESNKQLMKDFGASAKKHAFKSPGNFTYNTSSEVLRKMNSSGEELETLSNLGRNAWKETEGFLGKESAKNAFNFYRENTKIWSGLDSTDRWKVGSAVVAKGGLDSVMNHVMKPTGELLKGKVNFETATAGVVSAFGVYEGINAVNQVSDGDYSGAFASLAGFAGLKLAYSQGMNLRAIDKVLKEKDMTWGGVFKAGVGGYGSKKFVSGLDKMTNEQMSNLSKMSSGIAQKLSNIDKSPLVVGPNLKREIDISARDFQSNMNSRFANSEFMNSRIIKNKYTSSKANKELTHGMIMDYAGGSWTNNVLGSSLLFGTTGMAVGGLSSDSSMLEGLAYGVGTGVAKGALFKVAIDSYAKGSVKEGNAILDKGRYKITPKDDTSLLFNGSNFMNGLF